jgi:hypothetical protein
MNRYNYKVTILSISILSAILAFTIIIQAAYITPSLAQTSGNYIEVSRIINVPKNIPNSSSITGNNANQTGDNSSSSSSLISPALGNYQQISLMFM